MAYGITNRNQMIDVNTIRKGCQELIIALRDFDKCGKLVCKAGETCTKKALSVDNSSLEGQISEIGEQIKAVKGTYEGYANELIQQAMDVYREQENEYNNYLASLQNQNNSN